jgi:serine/threonine protein kinase
MDAPPTSHPTDRTLHAYATGNLDDRSVESVGQHLKSCPDCRRRVAEFGSARRRDSQDQPDSPPPVGSSFPGISSVVGETGLGSPPPVDSMPPGLAELPDYQVISELGRGGMGVVYLAQNTLMGRKEVLKVVSRELMDRRSVSERFLREIRNAAQLQHPNIVTAYSAMRAGDRIVLAMEYVEGYDLAKLIKAQGPLPVAHACNFIYQAALGLQHAHERGMVHRDIKPSNLMFARQGKRAFIKILDFGLAKATQEAPIDGGLTREGQMLGTPDYIAPEQSLNAQKADIRADIYSLGCTLYYLLTGGPPFQATSLYEILQAHHSMDATPLNLARPEVPVELAGLVAKMMAKEPESRFQTPGEVAQAIKPFFKPGGSWAAKPKLETPRAVTAATGRGAGAIPPKPATNAAPAPAFTAGKSAKPAYPGPAPGMIDLGQEDGLSEERAALIRRGSRSLAWLWPSVAGGAFLLGLVLAWKLGFDPGRKGADGVPPEPIAATRLQDNDRGTATKPSNAAPLARDEPAPPPAQESRPDRGSIAASPAVPNAATPAVVTEPKISKRSSNAAPRASGGDRPIDAKIAVVLRPRDIRQLQVRPEVERIRNPDGMLPQGGIWPTLTADNLTAWQVSDPDHIEINHKGVFLSAGPNGNLLVTKRETYKSCTLTLTLAATKGTEAFLSLRAHRDPDGWHALTARVTDEGGKIRVDHPSLDLEPSENGTRLQDLAPEKPFFIKFEIKDENVARVRIKREVWPMDCSKPPASEYTGAVGLFVKSGTLIIFAMNVQE